MCGPLCEVPVRSWGHRFGGQKRAPEPGPHVGCKSRCLGSSIPLLFALFRLKLDEICGSACHLVEGILENSLRQPDDEASGCFLPRDNLCLEKIMQRRNDKRLQLLGRA